jgi:hypothetical protein
MLDKERPSLSFEIAEPGARATVSVACARPSAADLRLVGVVAWRVCSRRRDFILDGPGSRASWVICSVTVSIRASAGVNISAARSPANRITAFFSMRSFTPAGQDVNAFENTTPYSSSSLSTGTRYRAQPRLYRPGATVADTGS